MDPLGYWALLNFAKPEALQSMLWLGHLKFSIRRRAGVAWKTKQAWLEWTFGWRVHCWFVLFFFELFTPRKRFYWMIVVAVGIKSGEIIATSHDLGPQKATKEGKSPSGKSRLVKRWTIIIWPDYIQFTVSESQHLVEHCRSSFCFEVTRWAQKPSFKRSYNST